MKPNPIILVESITIPHTAFAKALGDISEYADYATDSTDPLGFVVYGDSGTGKTWLKREIMKGRGRERKEETDGDLVPVASAQLLSTATINALGVAILSTLDAGDDSRYTEVQLTHRIITLMRECKTKILIVDDCHYIVDRRTQKVWSHADDFLKVLREETKCILILFGLRRFERVINENAQIRTILHAPLYLPTFDWRNADEKSEFIACLEGFYNVISQYYSVPNISSEEWSVRMYCATGGIMRLLANFLKALLIYADTRQKEVLDMNDFAKVYRDVRYKQPEQSTERCPFDPNFFATSEVLEQVRQIGSDQQGGNPQARSGSQK